MRSLPILAAFLAMLTASCSGPAPATNVAVAADNVADALFIGDDDDQTVKQFEVNGTFVGRFINRSGGLRGPMGMIFDDQRFVLVNQNVNKTYPGEILAYDGVTGNLLERIVPRSDPDAPFAPRGIVRGNEGVLYVGNLGPPPGVPFYDGTSGALLGTLDTSPFSPRGVVFGPDGLLYVSLTNLPDQNGGGVMRFDTSLPSPVGQLFVDSRTCRCDLNRPEGLVFGPDGRLYVTSFRALDSNGNSTDNDKILVFDASGSFVDEIDLWEGTQARAFAQALLFGPAGKLFVPISNTGAVRRYDVATHGFDTIVPSAAAGGPLVKPFYLTFRHTNPSTLAYGP